MVLRRFSLARLGWLALPFALALGGSPGPALARGPAVDEPSVDEPSSALGGVDEPPASPTEPGSLPPAPTEPGSDEPTAAESSESGDEPANDVPAAPRGLGVAVEFAGSGVPRPLLDRLDVVSQREPGLAWVKRVVVGLRMYAGSPAGDATLAVEPVSARAAATPSVADPQRAALDLLASEAAAGAKLADAASAEDSSEIRRAVHALERWVALRRAAGLAPRATPDSAAVADAIARIDELLADRPGAADWRAYLLLPELSKMLAAEAAGALNDAGRAPAFAAIQRVRGAPASPAAREFLARPQVAALADELERWTIGPIEARDAFDALVEYEDSGDRAAGRLVAAAVALGTRSNDAAAKEFATLLEQRYRGPNVRVSAHVDLLNRFMPQPAAESAPVREMIADHPVTGRSTTVTKTDLRLVPDPHRLSFELHARGTLWSRTIADASVARFATFGHSEYEAVSPVRLDANGLSVEPTQVYVAGNTRLLGVSTDLENVPILGGLLEQYARSRHDEQKDAVKVEMESRVGQKVRDKLDSTLQPKLREAQAKFNARVLAPLARVSLRPEVSDFQTTADRIVLRTRLATGAQLASYTPRPMAPGDSLASVQLHESAINNCVEQLGFAGRRMNFHDIRDHVASRLQLKPAELPAEAPTDLFFTFAEEGPVQVRLLDDLVEVTLRLKKFEVKDRSGDDLTVTVRYRLKWEDAGLELVRDGGIQLAAEGQTNGKRLFLRAVFLKIFPKSKPMTLVARDKLVDPRLADLTITQLLVRDGWVSAAIGPSKRTHTAPVAPSVVPPAAGKSGRAIGRLGFPGRTAF